MWGGVGIKQLGNQGKVQYAYLLLTASFVVMLGFVILENRMVVQIRDRIDNVLTLSGFSGTLCDLQKISGSMEAVKKNVDGEVYYDFEKMYENADIVLEEKGMKERVYTVLQKNISGDGMMKKLIAGYSLEEVILYNEPVQEMTVAPNGVPVTGPGLYLRIKLNIRGILGKLHTVYVDKCIVVKWNLQI